MVGRLTGRFSWQRFLGQPVFLQVNTSAGCTGAIVRSTSVVAKVTASAPPDIAKVTVSATFDVPATACRAMSSTHISSSVRIFPLISSRVLGDGKIRPDRRENFPFE
jgi:hypothetical protein